MQFSEHLSAFSVGDLRELARRRGVLVSQEALRSRQTLVRNLANVLSRWDTVYAAVSQLSQAESDALVLLSRLGGEAGLARLAEAGQADPSAVKGVLEQLRLWGLVFPEGDWEHPVIPPAVSQSLSHLVGPHSGETAPARIRLAAPELQTVKQDVSPRPASILWDAAEVLARVARARFKLTQAGRLNKRDLRAMEAGPSLTAMGYSELVYLLLCQLRLFAVSAGTFLCVARDAEAWLALDQELQAASLLDAWLELPGFPESAPAEPWEAAYAPTHQSLHRSRVVRILAAAPADTVVSVKSIAARLRWEAPRTFGGGCVSDPAARRLCRSLHWLGLLAVDQPAQPEAVRLTPLGAALAGGVSPPPGALIPPDPQFILQPNSEAFAPPNLAPRTLFHLRRLTGEKKGAPAGLFPLTPESLRRALDTGVTGAEIVAFLETHSRTGLPANVRAQIEAVSRQHGRIRLVPTEYVLLTDDPALMRELRAAPPLATLLGTDVAPQAAPVEGANAAELLRRLRQRGYAPLDASLPTEGPPLPPSPQSPPPAVTAARRPALDWSALDAPAPARTTERAVDPTAIHSLIEEAADNGTAVEIEYDGSRNSVCREVLEPIWLGDGEMVAYCPRLSRDVSISLQRIKWARHLEGVTGGI
jgi:hypothetical protein